jgi:hypothetical protein
VSKILEARFIREVIHSEWLANPVIMPKANSKLWMCVDYTHINKACPKDPFLLPHIDQVGDAYSGYHQISMAKKYLEKTSFTTLVGRYCNVRVPLGLKNVGPTF